MGTCAFHREAWLRYPKPDQCAIPICRRPYRQPQTINHQKPMPAFPRNLQEIKDRRELERRPKPKGGTADELTPDLGGKFEQANLGEVLHAHHGDDEPGKHGPKSLAQKKFLGKTPGERADLFEGFYALNEIQAWIIGETSRLLDKINHTICDFNRAATQAKRDEAQQNYDGATTEFNNFVASLNNPTPAAPPNDNFGPTINSATVEPIQTGGYYTSARVIIEWRGGTHSGSSLIHVP